MLIATTAISVLAILDERPSLEEIMTWVDVETLTLLFSMMLIGKGPFTHSKENAVIEA